MNDGIIPMTPIQARIFNELKTGKSLSRSNLVELLNTPRTTIYDNLVKLQKKKLVKKYSKPNENRPVWGRPVVLWKIPQIILNELRKKLNLIDGMV